MSSFFDIGLVDHIGQDNQILKLEKLLDWSKFSKYLKNVHSKDGPTGYDTLQMFKCLLLQSWHSLSDPGLENALRVRLDFLQFTGFSVGDNLPDETTICKFRNKLVAKKKFAPLFNEVNHQLEAIGLKVKSANLAIVDATIIDSNARPRKVIEADIDYQTSHSADPDASWVKKGKRAYFGYRAYACADAEGFIGQTHVEPANCSEMKQLSKVTDGLAPGARVQADKGFSSKDNRAYLRSIGLKNGLMYKAHRNKPLTKWMKKFNREISRTRFRIEQCFGTIKRRFGYVKASYFTREKVDAQFMMKALCQNLLKAINKVSFS